MFVEHPAGSKHTGSMPLPEIIICATHRDGLAHAAELGRPPSGFIFITPRSPHGARGQRASAIHITDDMRQAPSLKHLQEETAPALATYRR